jgi:hypothetical protein
MLLREKTLIALRHKEFKLNVVNAFATQLWRLHQDVTKCDLPLHPLSPRVRYLIR